MKKLIATVIACTLVFCFMTTSAVAMELSVKAIFSGQTITLEVDPVDSIESIKAKIEEQAGYPSNQQRLYYNGEMLEEGRTLNDYNIEDQATLFLSLRDGSNTDTIMVLGQPNDFDVTVIYQAGEATETVCSVELTWGAMEFTYSAASAGVWNPTTLQYEGQGTATWTCEADANKITVKNRSNAAMDVSFALTPEEGIAGGFYDAANGGNTIEGNVFTLASAAPTGGGTTGTEQIGSAYVHITSGALTSGQTAVTIGRVTVTITN